MSLTNDIKSATVKNMSSVNHINKSTDTSKMLSMIEGKKKYGKQNVLDALDEAMSIEGDIDEISLNPFSNPKKRIEKITKKFVSSILKELPKIKVKQLPEILKLLNQTKVDIESRIKSFTPNDFNDRIDAIDNAVDELTEVTGAASGGSFLGPLFVSPSTKKTQVIKRPMGNIKPYTVSEQETDDTVEDNEVNTDSQFDFFKGEYEPQTKTYVGAYLVGEESPKQLTVYNIRQYPDNYAGFMGRENKPYSMSLHSTKLPISQIEILGDVPGKDGFKFIRMPYWFFKKNDKDLKVQRFDEPRGLYLKSGVHTKPENMEKLFDPMFEKYFEEIVYDDFDRRKYDITKNNYTLVKNRKLRDQESDLDEGMGFSPQLKSDDNPNGETEGLTTDVMNRILKKVIDRDEDLRGDVDEVMMRIGDESLSNLDVSGRAEDDYTNKDLVDDIGIAADRANVKAEITYGTSGHGKMTKSGNVSRHYRGLAVDVSRLQDLENSNETKPMSYKDNPKGFKVAGDRLCSELEKLGYNRNAEGSRNPKAVLWYMNDGSHKNHLHVSNTEGENNQKVSTDKKKTNIVKQNLTIKDIVDNGDNSQLLAVGSSGEGVNDLQSTLMSNGYDLPEKGIDGLYGPETKSAVTNFQKDKELKVDGIVGIETATELTKLSEETVKMDTKEATLSSSSGSYETPFFLAKDAKNHRGAAKTQIPNGKFVKIKDKCKTYPYCNQGDIKALELFEDGKYSKMADKVAKDMGEDPLKVKSIILNDLEESLFRERMKQTNQERMDKAEKNNKNTDK